MPLEEVRPCIFPAHRLAAVGLLHQECHAEPSTIGTQAHRGRQEEQEPSHVPFSYAAVEPHAVVIEPGHASIAHAAVFGPGWFFRFARAAVSSRHVQQSVECVRALRLAPRRVFEHARIDEARHDERHEHQGDASRCQPSMPGTLFSVVLQLQQRVSGVHPCAIDHAHQQEKAERQGRIQSFAAELEHTRRRAQHPRRQLRHDTCASGEDAPRLPPRARRSILPSQAQWRNATMLRKTTTSHDKTRDGRRQVVGSARRARSTSLGTCVRRTTKRTRRRGRGARGRRRTDARSTCEDVLVRACLAAAKRAFASTNAGAFRIMQHCHLSSRSIVMARSMSNATGNGHRIPTSNVDARSSYAFLHGMRCIPSNVMSTVSTFSAFPHRPQVHQEDAKRRDEQ